jgi:hypothetical protein
MTWAYEDHPHYRMALTDGYISSVEIFGNPDKVSEEKPEMKMAEKFYSDNTLPGQSRRHGNISILHVWVIGEKGWLDQAPAQTEILQRIHESDSDNNYRLFIVGFGWSDRYYRSDWHHCLRTSGMVGKKKHAHETRFKDAGRLLLELMADEYDSTRKAPSAVLDRFGIPYSFQGTDGRSRVE